MDIDKTIAVSFCFQRDNTLWTISIIL